MSGGVPVTNDASSAAVPAATAQASWREARWLPLIVLAYVVAYVRAIGFALVWDDQLLTQHGTFNASLGRLLLSPQQALLDETALHTRGASVTQDSYRPLETFSHVVDLRWLGGTPAAMHAHNLLLGALAIWLAHTVLLRLMLRREAALCTALFALHPLQVEAVAYVSARGDLLAAIGALLSVLCALCAFDASRASARFGWCVAASLSFAASLFAKEAYAGVPALVLGLALARPERGFRDSLRAAAPVVLAQVVGFGAYLGLRTLAMGATVANVGRAPWQAVLAWPAITLQYARTFLLPLDLSIDRAPDTALVLVGWVVIVAAGVGLYLLWRRPELRPRLAPGLLGLGCALILLGPAAVAVNTTEVLADRYAYLAVLAFAYCLLQLYAAVRAAPARRPLALLGIGWVLMLAFVHVGQLESFRDNWALYAHDAAFAPTSSMAQYRLGYLLARRGDMPRARTYFERALQLDPVNAKAHNNLGTVLLEQGELSRSQAELEAAIALTPGLNYRAWYNLAEVRRRQGDARGACAAVHESLAINPAYDKARSELRALCDDPAALPSP